MPNPNPTRRARKSSASSDVLPPGFKRRADGRLQLRWTDRAGRRRDVYGWTVDECNAKRYAPIAPEPVRLLPDSSTTGAYLEVWIAGLDGRPNSNATHRHHVYAYLIPMVGDVLLEDLATPAGRELLRIRFAELRERRSRYGRPLAPRTIAMIHATLRRALNRAVEDGRIPSNPAARLNPNGTSGSRARSRRLGLELAIPTDDELRAVAVELEGSDRIAFELSVLTGLRQSELLGLGWDALEHGSDRAGSWIHVSRALRRSRGADAPAELDDPKTATSDRWVPLSPRFDLRALAQLQRVRQVAAGPTWSGNPDGLLFTDERGRPVNGSTLSHRLTEACRRAGVRPFRWHDLRHAYASGLINRGVPIALVSKYLGHANVAITSEVYHHLIRTEDHSAAIAAASAILG